MAPVAGQVSEGSAETNPKRRACEPEFGNGTETMFADGYPYLLATEASPRTLMRLSMTTMKEWRHLG